jgi:hypothetical protein
LDSIAFNQALRERTDDIYRSHPDLRDHRIDHPWLMSSLGNPYAGIWFVGENPSLTQVERARDPGGGPPSEEAQWYASRGDKLFRRALLESKFKEGSIDSCGGWNCYVTNLIKQPAFVEDWKKDPNLARSAALCWAPVFRWQLQQSKPRLVVFMGRKVTRLAGDLISSAAIKVPLSLTIEHYSYVAMRPKGTKPPMDPTRVAEYLDSFSDVRRQFDAISSQRDIESEASSF